MFLAKYDSLVLYDEDLKKIFIIDHEQLQFDKTDGWTLFGIPEKEDGTFSDHEYFAYTMIYLIELNQLIKIKKFCGSFHIMKELKTNLRVKQ